MSEHRALTTSESTREAVLAANFANDRAVIVTQRLMDYVGLDPAAEERQEVPLAGLDVMSGSAGKKVSRTIRSAPIPRGLAGDGSGVRVVEARDEYHIKRALMPSFLGGLAHRVSTYSMFYMEPVAGTPAEGNTAVVSATNPDTRMYAGHVGLEATDENIQRGMEATSAFIGQMRDVMMASCLSWPPSLIEPVRALSSDA